MPFEKRSWLAGPTIGVDTRIRIGGTNPFLTATMQCERCGNATKQTRHAMRTVRKGIALPGVLQWADDVDDPNPFIASRFGSQGNSCAPQFPRLRGEGSSSDRATSHYQSAVAAPILPSLSCAARSVRRPDQDESRPVRGVFVGARRSLRRDRLAANDRAARERGHGRAYFLGPRATQPRLGLRQRLGLA
jgi:hypothetical protein